MDGRFTFTAAESGEHRLCFQCIGAGGWFSSSHIKLQLDLVVGETSDLDRGNKDQKDSLVQRVQELNARLQDIRREQVFQRVFAPSPAPYFLLFYVWLETDRFAGKGSRIPGSI